MFIFCSTVDGKNLAPRQEKIQHRGSASRYSHLCQCGALVLKQHFRGVRNTFGQFRHRRRRRRRHPDMWAIIIVPGLSRRYPGTCLCRVIIITIAVMLAAPHAVFCWRARVKVRVASESAALGLHWRAQREVCVGLGSAALTRMTVRLIQYGA